MTMSLRERLVRHMEHWYTRNPAPMGTAAERAEWNTVEAVLNWSFATPSNTDALRAKDVG